MLDVEFLIHVGAVSECEQHISPRRAATGRCGLFGVPNATPGLAALPGLDRSLTSMAEALLEEIKWSTATYHVFSASGAA
jgi:hypothetical protein